MSMKGKTPGLLIRPSRPSAKKKGAENRHFCSTGLNPIPNQNDYYSRKDNKFGT